jgi:hypothetical protein
VNSVARKCAIPKGTVPPPGMRIIAVVPAAKRTVAWRVPSPSVTLEPRIAVIDGIDEKSTTLTAPSTGVMTTSSSTTQSRHTGCTCRCTMGDPSRSKISVSARPPLTAKS